MRRLSQVLLFATLAGCAARAPLVIAPGPGPEPEPPQSVRRIDRNALGTADHGVAPPGARQIEEGYWLGGLLLPEHVPWLAQRGIRVVLSAVLPPDKTLFLLDLAGIEQVRVPMGGSFDHSDDILAVADANPPETIYVHCRHGADRTGAIAAFLLVMRHGWTIADALYSVLYADPEDAEGLADVLASRGIDDVRPADDPRVGFYSLQAVGQIGGLKARNRRYERLIETTLEAMEQAPPNERAAQLAPID